MDIFGLFISTIILRPYVFVWLGLYFVAGGLQLGMKRIIVFTILAYVIAFISEYCSTRIGVPYGYYYYTGETHGKELFISNVPFMDSISHSFLGYFSYSLALLMSSPVIRKGWRFELQNPPWYSKKVLFLSAIFFVLQDVLIDPVSLMGSKWFLGQIYYNPESALVKYYSGGCPAGTNYCRITPEGNVTPCPYMDTSCGNLREKSFAEIWNNSGILNELREADLKGRCGECEFESMCKGCRARALVTTGDQMEEDSWCDYEPGKYGGKKLTFKEENTFGLDKKFELPWSEDAKKRLGKVPSFGKGMVIKRVEQYAREKGYSEITPDIMKEAKEKMAVDKKAMFPFMNLLKKKAAKNRKIEWETEALERVKNAPDFVRPGIYKLMEKRAKEKGYKVITSAFLSEIRDESMQFASRRMNKLGFDELDMEAFDTAKAKTKNKKKKEVIDDIKDFLTERNVKNTEIIEKFQKYLSTGIEEKNKIKKLGE